LRRKIDQELDQELDEIVADLSDRELRAMMETLGEVLRRSRRGIGFAIVVLEPYPPVGPTGTVQISSNMEPSHLADAFAVLCHRIDAGDVNLSTPPGASRH
jgi:hypothetical protein